MNASVIIGAILYMVASLTIGTGLAHLFIGWAPYLVKAIVGFALMLPYAIFCLHEVPIKHRGVVKLFGRRISWGSDGNGLMEGWNFLPLPTPLMDVEVVDSKERTIIFEQQKAYSKDKIAMMFEGFVQYDVDDASSTLNVEGASDALRRLVIQATRAETEESDALALIDEDKEHLSDKIEQNVLATMRDKNLNWGLRIKLIRIEEINLPPELEVALRKEQQEKIERRYEQTQTKARRAQVKGLKDVGVDPNVAYVGSLVDAEKKGAEVKNNTVNVNGMSAVGTGLGKIGEGINKAIETLTGTKP